MSVKIGINGFGRIGRLVFRTIKQRHPDEIEVVAVNAFGNLLIRDNGGQIWRLCPEDLSCRVVAVETELIPDDGPNDEAGADAEGESEGVDHRIQAVTDQHTPGAGPIALEHAVS